MGQSRRERTWPEPTTTRHAWVRDGSHPHDVPRQVLIICWSKGTELHLMGIRSIRRNSCCGNAVRGLLDFTCLRRYQDRLHGRPCGDIASGARILLLRRCGDG